jgi:hypothetical protein
MQISVWTAKNACPRAGDNPVEKKHRRKIILSRLVIIELSEINLFLKSDYGRCL